MKTITSWAAGLAYTVLEVIWYLMKNMLIPIMSALSAVFCVICIFQAIRSYHEEDRINVQKNVKAACICLFITVCLAGIWVAVPKSITLFKSNPNY